jgi:hypothetical protein
MAFSLFYSIKPGELRVFGRVCDCRIQQVESPAKLFFAPAGFCDRQTVFDAQTQSRIERPACGAATPPA